MAVFAKSRTELYPTEIVAGVLVNLKKREIPSTMKELHTAFFQMRDKCPEVLSSFKFDTRGTFPYSPTIEQAITNLATSLLLERNNPKLNVYRRTKKLENHFRQSIKPKASTEDLKEISQIADYVSKTV